MFRILLFRISSVTFISKPPQNLSAQKSNLLCSCTLCMRNPSQGKWLVSCCVWNLSCKDSEAGVTKWMGARITRRFLHTCDCRLVCNDWNTDFKRDCQQNAYMCLLHVAWLLHSFHCSWYSQLSSQAGVVKTQDQSFIPFMTYFWKSFPPYTSGYKVAQFQGNGGQTLQPEGS